MLLSLRHCACAQCEADTYCFNMVLPMLLVQVLHAGLEVLMWCTLRS